MPKTVLLTSTCDCGADFMTAQSRQKAGRGRYCSKSCMYRFRIRPKGLRYNIVAKNPGWYAETYRGVHVWMRKHFQKSGVCESCDRRGKTEWANVDGTYRQVREDWAEWCPSCHRAHDHRRGARAEQRFGEGCFR
jgi:hypothetical protein